MLVCSTSSYGKEPSGSKEHPALPRIPGSIIVAYERNDQGEITIPLERIVFDLQTQKFNNFKTISASGRLTRILYALPAKSTTQEAAQYYTDALHQANGEIFSPARKTNWITGTIDLLIKSTTAAYQIAFTTCFS